MSHLAWGPASGGIDSKASAAGRRGAVACIPGIRIEATA